MLALSKGEDDDTAPAMTAAILIMETLFAIRDELTGIRKRFDALLKG